MVAEPMKRRRRKNKTKNIQKRVLLALAFDEHNLWVYLMIYGKLFLIERESKNLNGFQRMAGRAKPKELMRVFALAFVILEAVCAQVISTLKSFEWRHIVRNGVYNRIHSCKRRQ